MVQWNLVTTPVQIQVEFRVSAPSILTNSLHLLTYYEDTDPGLHAWIAETWRSVPPDMKHRQKLMSNSFGESLVNTADIPYPQFLQELAALPPEKFQEAALDWMPDYEGFPGREALADVEVLVRFLRQIYETKKSEHKLEEAIWRETHALLAEPARAKQLIVDHLTYMWETYLAAEWKRTEAMLRESAAAYARQDYRGLNAYDLVQAVTGRDMRGTEKLDESLAKARRMIFMPSPHIGPYLSWQSPNQFGDLIIQFGARMPRGAAKGSSALSRSELLVWLNALADDTRLKMLEMLVEQEELCAQDFIDMLELSQSSASRHLRQLTASGFLEVRRRDVNKCYSLNRERIGDTLKALGRLTQS